MNIVKWLLGHPLVAIWALGAIAIILAMESGNNKQHDTVMQNHDGGSQTVVETESVEIKPLSHEMSSANSVPVVNATQSVNVKEDSISSPKDGALETVPNNNVVPQNNSEPFTSSASDESNKKKVADKVAVVAEDLGQLETDELLLMAREAYWNNGLDEAAQIYQQLIKREPQVIEHKGELGNVYWRQGYPKKAAELYSEIAIPLIESGSSDRVTNMVGFIQLFYPQRVEVIMDRLERSNNK